MRPAAPVTTSRMSAMARTPVIGSSARLRPVVAFDDDQLVLARLRAQFLRLLVLLRIVAGEGGGVVLEFDDDLAGAGDALDGLVVAATHEEATAEFGECDGVRPHVGLVRLGIGDVDVSDPVTLGHLKLPRPEPFRFAPLPRATPWPPDTAANDSSGAPSRSPRIRARRCARGPGLPAPPSGRRGRAAALRVRRSPSSPPRHSARKPRDRRRRRAR